MELPPGRWSEQAIRERRKDFPFLLRTALRRPLEGARDDAPPGFRKTWFAFFLKTSRHDSMESGVRACTSDASKSKKNTITS